MANSAQTILMKKADGTFVRVPLSDLKKPVAKPVVTPIAKPVITPVVESKSTPIASSANISSTRHDEIEKIFSTLSFLVPPAFANRAKNIIQLRLKEIRGADDTRELVLRSTVDGGLGISAGQAEELEKKCLEMLKNNTQKISDIKPLKTREAVLQKFAEADLPANITPFNAFIHEAPSKTQPTNQPSPKPLNNPISNSFSPSSKPREDKFKISTESKPRPIIQDVTIHPTAMSPLDEIRYFRLLDLRRLASKPEEAINRLKQKFLNLKEESIVLFMDAIGVWHQSPLYLEYVEMVSRAFSNKTKLLAAEAGKDKITVVEIKLIVMMEKELGL